MGDRLPFFSGKKGILSNPWQAAKERGCLQTDAAEARLPRMSGMWTRLRSAVLGRCPSRRRMVPTVLEGGCQDSAGCQRAFHLGLCSLAKLFLDHSYKLPHKIPRKGIRKAGNCGEAFGSSPWGCWSDYHKKTKNSSLEKMTGCLPLVVKWAFVWLSWGRVFGFCAWEACGHEVSDAHLLAQNF